MLNQRFPTIFGALVIFAGALAGPTQAADEIDPAKVQVCGSCHGQNGVPLDPKTMPIIWGQQQNFLVKQLHDYRAGDRDNAIMATFAKGLKQEELRPAAAYFAAKAWPAKKEAAAAPAKEPEGMATCQICHQKDFVGGAPAPRLAGQSYEYLVEAMRSFADGERTNNADMVKLMQPLSIAEREAIARYISGL